MEDCDNKERPDGSWPNDVCLVKPGLLDPATDMEGVSETYQNVYYGEEKGRRRSCSETPRKQRKSKQRDAIGRKSDRVVTKPSVAVGDVTVLLIDLETLYFPEEKNGEHEMGELMVELHQPTEIAPQARDQEDGEKSNEPDGKVIV